jgi:D-alanyl-D-alanine carboxypeptidase
MKKLMAIVASFVVLAGVGFIVPQLYKPAQEHIENIVQNVNKPALPKDVFDSFSPEVQFLLVYNVNTKEYLGRNEKLRPESLASLVKILVAYQIVKDFETGVLKPTDSMNFEDWDGDGPDAVGITIKDALYHMLHSSSNSATNLLIDKLGGFEAATSKLQKNGFKDTEINCFVDPSQVDQKCGGTNQSTLFDMSMALEYLVNTDNQYTALAQKPMKETIYNYSHTNRVMNKSGINSIVIGNLALVDVDGTKYIVSSILSDPGSADRFDDFTENNNVRDNKDPNSKLDPISKVTQEVVNALEKYKI